MQQSRQIFGSRLRAFQARHGITDSHGEAPVIRRLELPAPSPRPRLTRLRVAAWIAVALLALSLTWMGSVIFTSPEIAETAAHVAEVSR
jgi:hypothetical protein